MAIHTAMQLAGSASQLLRDITLLQSSPYRGSRFSPDMRRWVQGRFQGFHDRVQVLGRPLQVSNLRLQNLLYEKQHYEADIRGCLRHQSAFSDADIELLPTVEFLQTVRDAGAYNAQSSITTVFEELAGCYDFFCQSFRVSESSRQLTTMGEGPGILENDVAGWVHCIIWSGTLYPEILGSEC